MSKRIPHTRDCCFHWDGECSCAPKTREELQKQIDYLIGSEKVWMDRAFQFLKERDEARKESLAARAIANTALDQRDNLEEMANRYLEAIMKLRDEAERIRDGIREYWPPFIEMPPQIEALLEGRAAQPGAEGARRF